jgi:hypothetical protein
VDERETAENAGKIKQGLPERVYGATVYGLSVIAAMICTLAPILVIALPGRNLMDPHLLFSAIWAGEKPSAIWKSLGGHLPAVHFWVHELGNGDSLIQLGLEIGCCSAGVGLLAASIVHLAKSPRSVGWALAAFCIAVFVCLAALGIYKQAA